MVEPTVLEVEWPTLQSKIKLKPKHSLATALLVSSVRQVQKDCQLKIIVLLFVLKQKSSLFVLLIFPIVLNTD